MPAARWTHGLGLHNKSPVKTAAGMRNGPTKTKRAAEKPPMMTNVMSNSTNAITMSMRLNVHGTRGFFPASVSFASIVEPPMGPCRARFPSLPSPSLQRTPSSRTSARCDKYISVRPQQDNRMPHSLGCLPGQTVLCRAPLSEGVRAIRFEPGGAVELVQVPNPKPGPEDVLVQVLAAGVCHTDLHLLDEAIAGDLPPLIPGHEIVGRITKVGGDVYAANVGDHVIVHFEQPCGRCRQCRRKRTNLCEEGHTLGFDSPGGYAELVVAKHSTVLPIQ